MEGPATLVAGRQVAGIPRLITANAAPLTKTAVNVDVPAATIFAALFALVTLLGFFSARWRAGDLTKLDEWALGGRRFGATVSWFLIGGDVFTASALVAVPAAVFGTGAAGFFAVPFTILAYPIMFAFMPRLWSVA